MARAKLLLTDEEKRSLDQLRKSKTAFAREVQRAQVLWRYSDGETVGQIARALNMTRKNVLKWIDKALQMGADAGIQDTPHKPPGPIIADDAKSWVVHLACSKPREFGYAAELWTRSHWLTMCASMRSKRAIRSWPDAKATVQRILEAQTLHPHKVKYYMERRNPDFLSKMKSVLLVYQEVALQNEAVCQGPPRPIVITVGKPLTAQGPPALPPRKETGP